MASQFSIKDGKQWKKQFFTIWLGQALSILGSQLVQFALIWYLTITTGSATVLATATLVGMLPGVILGPLIGTLVDRFNRRWVMLIADGVVAAATIGLAIFFFLSIVAEWQIYLVIFIRALAGCFHGNAMNASTSLMVPMEYLTRIQGMNQMLNGGLNVISAPLGALLLNHLPLQGILLIDVITAMFAMIPLMFITVPQPEQKQQKQSRRILQDFQAGFRTIRQWRGLMIVSMMTVGINFTIIPAFSLLPLMVKNDFGGNAIHLSWVESAMGIGMIAGGALLSVGGGFKRRILTSMLGLIGMGIGTLILALAPSSAIAAAVGGALLFGLMNPLTMGPFFAVIQSSVAPDMQARVFSILSSVGGGIAPIGLMIAGPIAERYGIQSWFFMSGIFCIAMGLGGVFTPAVMDMEQHPQQTTQSILDNRPAVESS